MSTIDMLGTLDIEIVWSEFSQNLLARRGKKPKLSSRKEGMHHHPVYMHNYPFRATPAPVAIAPPQPQPSAPSLYPVLDDAETQPTSTDKPGDESSTDKPKKAGFKIDALRCPIMDELMADPVVASDGFTYEAENLRKAWSAARERATEHQPEHESCGRASEEFVLRSPMTNEAMDNDHLTPNHLIVQLIESIIESGGIPTDEAEEWRERRKAVVAKRNASTTKSSLALTIEDMPPSPSAERSPRLRPPPPAWPASATTRRLQARLERLETQRTRLQQGAANEGSSDRERERAFIDLSRVDAEYERVQAQLLAALEPPPQRRSISRSVSLGLRRARDTARERACRAHQSVRGGGGGLWSKLRQRLDANRQQAEARRAMTRQQAEDKTAAQREADHATAAYLRSVDPFTGMPVQPGDLRMCGRCHAGPWRKTGCNNMGTHNTIFFQHNGNHTHNRCRNCYWFCSDWTKWPEWDGVVGPH